MNFLRRIRQRLIDNGNLQRYVVYAAGEILLVMIGILLALQVNNWNTTNKEQSDQLQQLSKLKSEIESMQEFLQSQISILQSATDGAGPLLELMGPEATMKVQPDSLNYLIFKTANTDLVTVEKLLFDTQINFESIAEKKYDELGLLLLSWKHFSGRIAADFSLIEANREVGLQKALMNCGIPGFAVLYTNDHSSKFPIEYESMLRSTEVYANLYHRHFRIRLLIHDLKGGLDQLDYMLDEINKY